MNQPLPSYSDFKPAGLPWLAEVPEHWEMTSNSRLFRIKKSIVGVTHSEHTLLSLTLKGVILRDLENAKGKFPAEFDTYQKVQAGNFIFCLFDIDETPRTVGLALQSGMITGAYTVFECLQPEATEYLHYYYQYLDSRKLLKPLYTGLRKAIKKNAFLSLKTPFPPLSEQQRIVAFLDGKTRQMARLLRNKRQLIKLLTEQKQTLIQRAVTQGLYTDTPRKNSGVQWLGEVPSHWEVKRIKYLLRELDNRSTTGAETLLSMRMHHGLVPYNEHFERPQQSINLIGYKLVKRGQLVINRMQAGNGVIFFSDIEGLVSPDYAVFELISNVNPVFLGEVFRAPTTRKKFKSESKGLGTGTSGFLRLYTDRLGAIHLALPPRAEQDFIMEEMNTRLSKTNETIARAQREIELIQEYRTRLIADVVTGQVDLRHLADAASGLELPAEDEMELDDEESEEEILAETEDGRE